MTIGDKLPSVSDLLCYNIRFKETALYRIITNLKRLIETSKEQQKINESHKGLHSIFKMLDNVPKGKLPFVFPPCYNKDLGRFETAWDVLIQLCELSPANRVFLSQFFKLMLKHDSEGSLYQRMIEDNIHHLIEQDIDISPYFLNPMTHRPLTSRYPVFTSEADELMIPINLSRQKCPSYFDNEEFSEDYI